jgi:tyrosine-protein phosphatase SIW14
MAFRVEPGKTALARIFLLAALVLPQAYAAAPSTTLPVAGLHHFLQVNDHIYRGAQPTRVGIRSLAKRGVRAIVDLRAYGWQAESEKKEVESLGMKFYSVPMPPLSAPSEDTVSKALGLLDDSQNWPVFIHCEHGNDRTGTIVACYRMTAEHWSNKRALAEAEDHGLSRFERGMRGFILRYRASANGSILAEPNR